MTRDRRGYLWDVAQAADRIMAFIAGKSFADYLADSMLRSAVERQFTIIGEAIVQLRRLDPATAAAIPDLADIIAFRNILVHGYANVDDQLVWGIVERELAPLRAAVERLMKE